MKLLKGVTVYLILFLLCIVAPFNIHASQETIIVPSWYSSTVQQEWQSKVQIKNYCEGTNSSTASCQLTFNVNGNYYGYIYFDGYHDNQFLLDYQPVFISGGQGKYYYNIYQNAVIDINRVTIQGLNLVQPQSNVDLTQIIQLLTSINNYEQQSIGYIDNIESNQLTSINEIKNVVNELIESNGYLETITKLHYYNFPFESLTFVSYLLYRYPVESIVNYSYYEMPIFRINQNNIVYTFYGGVTFHISFLIDQNLGFAPNFNTYFELSSGSITNFKASSLSYAFNGNFTRVVSFDIVNSSSGLQTLKYIYSNSCRFIPIYFGYADNKNISTDFALMFGMSNQLLDDLHVISNGTTQSNQQASDLSSGTDSMQQQMNSFTAQEDSYNQQMNNSINAIDFTSPVSQNAGILPAANFVINIFNGLIENNAFSVLILIVCVLIIGKKVIGK